MKKILALALAMIMTLGLASVAFATPVEPEVFVAEGQTIYYKNGSGKIVGLPEQTEVEPETEVYVPLSGDDCGDKTVVNKYKAFFDSKVGKMAEGPSIVFVKLSPQDEYYYCVTFKTPAVSTKAYDLAGDLKVAKTASAAKNLVEENYTKLNLEVAYGVDTVDTNSHNIVAPVLDFEIDDVVDLEDEEGDLFLYTVDVTGQSDVNMKYSVKFDSAFAAKYDYANVDFLKFTKNPVFNRTGDLYIYADEDSYIYEVTEDGAKEIKNAEYDEDYGAWHIRTRRLGSYAIADQELKATEAASSSEAGNAGKPNPDTGR